MNQPSPNQAPRYLLVKHSKGWNVDRCCTWMDKNDQPFDWFYPAEGGPFPSLQVYAGIIVFGGASSANDDCSCEWVKDELIFIEAALKASTSFLGICLGAQMLARVLGAPVFKHPADAKEVGFHKVYPTTESGNFLQAEQTFMQWHSEGFDLPPDCKSIARGEVFPNQAFKHSDNVYGLQFHPEVNPAALAIWHERSKRRNPSPLNDDQRASMMQDAHRHDASITQWLDNFLTDWTRSGVQSNAAKATLPR